MVSRHPHTVQWPEVVCFLRKVIWLVPGFTAERHRDRLAELHGIVERDGEFTSTALRILVRAHKP